MRIDKKDQQLIDLLQKNARISFTKMGVEVGLTSAAVADRVRKLEDEGVILSYGILLDPSLIGYPLHAIIHLRAFVGMLKPFLARVPSLKEIRNCYRVTGNENIIMEVVLTDQKHLEKLIDLLISYGETRTHIVLSQVVRDAPIHSV